MIELAREKNHREKGLQISISQGWNRRQCIVPNGCIIASSLMDMRLKNLFSITRHCFPRASMCDMCDMWWCWGIWYLGRMWGQWWSGFAQDYYVQLKETYARFNLHAARFGYYLYVANNSQDGSPLSETAGENHLANHKVEKRINETTNQPS